MRRSLGFTLIELMIVVAIIGLLSGVAVPKFYEFQKRSYTGEVRTNGMSMLNTERSYFAEFNAYVETAKNPSSIPSGAKLPWENDPTWHALGFEPDGRVRFQYRIHGKDLHVHAHGDLDGDGKKSTYKFKLDGTEDIDDPLE